MKIIRSLFGGDYEISEDNLHTKVHKYQKNDKYIIFAAVNHWGSKRYYKKIEKILDRCNCVIYEPISQKSKKINDKFLVEIVNEKENSLNKIISKYPEFKERADKIKRYGKNYSNVFLLDLEEAYYLVKKYYNTKPMKGVEKQTKHINMNKENWIPCDIYKDEGFEKFSIESQEKIKRMDKKILANLILTELEGMILADKNQLTYKQLIKEFKNGQFDMLSIMEKVIGAFKDKNAVFEKLNEKLKDENLKKLGMIFGAGHGPIVREVIENLGFKEIKTLTLNVF